MRVVVHPNELLIAHDATYEDDLQYVDHDTEVDGLPGALRASLYA